MIFTYRGSVVILDTPLIFAGDEDVGHQLIRICSSRRGILKRHNLIWCRLIVWRCYENIAWGYWHQFVVNECLRQKRYLQRQDRKSVV